MYLAISSEFSEKDLKGSRKGWYTGYKVVRNKKVLMLGGGDRWKGVGAYDRGL